MATHRKMTCSLTNKWLIITIVLLSIASWIYNISVSEMSVRRISGVIDEQIAYEENTLVQSWISLGSYDGLKYFYVKKGSNETYNENKTITLSTMCDIDLIYEAREIAINYKYGPLSVGVYIDEDVSTYFINRTFKQNITQILHSNFENISNAYDIYIGICFARKSSAFYKSKHFTSDTSIIWKLPYNALRNLAESQVQTAWVFYVDIDFRYFSATFNNLETHFFNQINGINTDKTVFIVPPFEESEALINSTMNSRSLTKKQLKYMKEYRLLHPFHLGAFPRGFNCTQYDKWYRARSHYMVTNCIDIEYEPWYIMKTSVSRRKEYQWQNKYVGRGRDKMSRMVTLRHYCFRLLVMHNMFIIHAADKHYDRSLKGKKMRTHPSDYGNWQNKNVQRNIEDILEYQSDNASCLPPVHFHKRHSHRIHKYDVKKPPEKPEKLKALVVKHKESFKEQRVKMPEKCKKFAQHKGHQLNFTEGHNWLPYYLRCRYKPHPRPWGMNDYGAIYWGMLTKQLVYSHTFKSGGTTIENGIESLINDNKVINFTKSQYNYNDTVFLHLPYTRFRKNATVNSYENLRTFLHRGTYVFTFIRDPISKFLAAFFEINKRAFIGKKKHLTLMRRKIQTQFQVKWEDYAKMDSLRVLKELVIPKMLHPQVRTGYFNEYYFDPHFVPNTFFVMPNGKQRESLPFNFIGNLENIEQDLPKILAPFITDDELKNDPQLLMDKYFQTQRSRFDQHNAFNMESENSFSNEEISEVFEKYTLNMTQLDDEIIQSLCEIYWVDYLCFPFDIPPQCNVDKLVEKHYVTDLLYSELRCA